MAESECNMSTSICIKSCVTEQEAEVVKAILETNGIHAMVSTDDYVGLPLTISGGVKVFVLKEDADNARDILTKTDED